MRDAWLRLLRVPNLFTVPGDPLAGFMLVWAAGFHPEPYRAVFCVSASLLLYSFGLITNDLFDLEVDIRERPDRPLASGQIRRSAALTAAVVFGTTGICMAFLTGWRAGVLGVLLTLVILLYNGWGKHVPVWGPVNMGLCRGLSLLLGSAAAGWAGLTTPVVIVSATGLTLYVAAVTQIARREMEPGAVGPVRWLPTLALLAWFAVFQVFGPWGNDITSARVLSTVAALSAVIGSVGCARSIVGQPGPAAVSRAVGEFLRGLFFVQAALVTVVLNVGAIIAAGLILMFFLSSRLGKRFYSS